MDISSGKQPILEIRKACKTYSGVYAIKDIDLTLFRGEVHALVGENGAGKSTLVKPLAGAIELTSGDIILEGIKRHFRTPSEALRAGIAMVYQETSLVPTITVSQNIHLGRENFLTRLSKLHISGQQIMQSMNFDVNPTATVASLGAAQKQMVEIARAVSLNVKIIVFDEPTATLTPEEKQHFFYLVEFLAKRGVSIIFISHALEESLEIADRITVLRDGERVVTEDAKSFTRETLVRNMVGRDLSQTHYSRDHRSPTQRSGRKKKVLSVENVTMGTMVKNMSFSLYAGEIAAMAGLVGSGRTEIAKIIFGALKRNLINGGMIYLENKPIRYRVPRQAVNDGIVYLTEDRKLNGFFETMTISDNIYLGWLSTKIGGRFFFSRRECAETGKNWIQRLNVQTLSPAAKVIELSGGNQQKVVVAKSLVQKPKVVIFDEPTRGVDVAAIQEIHDIIRSLAKEGIAVLVISSYLPEVLSLADRILVVQKGQIVEEFSSENATEENIMYAAVH